MKWLLRMDADACSESVDKLTPLMQLGKAMVLSTGQPLPFAKVLSYQLKHQVLFHAHFQQRTDFASPFLDFFIFFLVQTSIAF